MAYKLVEAEKLEAGLQKVCDRIRAKTGGTELFEFPDEMADAVDSIEQGGESSGGLDMMQYLSAATFGADVQEVTEDIVLHLERATTIGNMFDLKVINAKKVTVYISEKCTNMMRSFGRSGGTVEVIKIIGDTRNVTPYSQAFDSRRSVHEIDADLDFSSATTTSNMFNNCVALQTFRIVPNTLSVSLSVSHSPDLTDETVQSIIDGLADLTGGTAQTLTLHADVKAKLTETQIATITGKNWTLA